MNQDGVLTITLDRPEQLNAFTGVMQNELIDACDRADADDNVRAIIVTGRGRGFCAGADLSGGSNTFNANSRGRSTDISTYRDGGGQRTADFRTEKRSMRLATPGRRSGFHETLA